MKILSGHAGFAALAVVLPATALAAPVALLDNRVIIDNPPFYSVGPEDGLGSGNFALNHPGFIDIPYALFDFGTTTAVSSAVLDWNFLSLFGGSGPAEITLYVGNDADGVITVDDRFMGVAVDTFTYSGGEVRSFDLTAYVNASLAAGKFFAARLEATVAPGNLRSYYGGQFQTPSMDAVARAVPEPATFALLGFGLAGIAFARRRNTA